MKEVWSVDCLSDTLMDGRPISILTVANQETNQGLCAEFSMATQKESAEQTLDSVACRRGYYPGRIESNHQKEFASKSFISRCSQHSIMLELTEVPDSISAVASSTFSETFRRDCLDREVFSSLEEARLITDIFLNCYNSLQGIFRGPVAISLFIDRPAGRVS